MVLIRTTQTLQLKKHKTQDFQSKKLTSHPSPQSKKDLQARRAATIPTTQTLLEPSQLILMQMTTSKSRLRGVPSEPSTTLIPTINYVGVHQFYDRRTADDTMWQRRRTNDDGITPRWRARCATLSEGLRGHVRVISALWVRFETDASARDIWLLAISGGGQIIKLHVRHNFEIFTQSKTTLGNCPSEHVN